jgi:hypothetical protein
VKHLILTTSLLLAAVPAAGLEGFRYSRTIDVDAPGWTSVRLDGNALVHAADLTLLGPAGTEVALRVAADSAERRPVRVLGVEETPSGWAIGMDLGGRPPRHDRLFFDFRQQANVPGCRLEASDDKRSWTPVAEADLFLLGRDGNLRLNVLDYAPSTARYLRLHWPRAAGLPELRRVEAAEMSSTEVLELDHRPLEVGAEIDLPPAAHVLERLDLELESSGVVAYRLLAAAEGHWQVRATGVARGEDVRLRHSLALQRGTDPTLVLELHGDARLRRASARRAARRLVFNAAEAGRYVLAYGSVSSGSAVRAARSGHEGATVERLAHVEAGPEEAGAWPPIPASISSPAGPLDDTFEFTWRIAKGDARAGTPVWLELNDAVRAAARSDLGDLRLDAGGRQLPYVRQRLPRPTRVLRQKVRPQEDGPVSSYTLAVPTHADLDLVLTTAKAPFERRLSGHYAVVERAGVDRRRTEAFAVASWQCPDRQPLPCDFRRSIGRPASGELRIEVSNGDNPPLGDLEAELWTHRDVLVFVWPGQDVVLRAGADVGTPRYDLANLADLLARREMMVVEAAERLEVPSEPTLPPWALPAAIGLAAAVLLLLLVRMVRS